MGVSFSNCHTGQGGQHICRAELQQSPGGKWEMLLMVWLHFPLTPISHEEGCSVSHEQSFQLQNVPWPGFSSFHHSRCTKVAQSHFTGLGAENGDEEMPDLCHGDTPPVTGSTPAADNWEPSTGASTAPASKPQAPGAPGHSCWARGPSPSSAPRLRWGRIPFWVMRSISRMKAHLHQRV